MLSFNHLKLNLKKDFSAQKKTKISILSENSGQLLAQAIKGYGYECGYNAEINYCGYDEIDIQVFEPQSQLNTFLSEYILIFPSVQKLQKIFYSKTLEEKESFAEGEVFRIKSWIDTLNEKSTAKIILANFLEINDAVFGNYSSKTRTSFIYQLRKINFQLMDLSQKNPNLFINDIVSLQNLCGLPFILDNKFYINSDIVFSIDFLPYLAKNTWDIVKSINGKIVKCLILDLDNTLWGGIIGDDGIESIQIGNLGIGKAFSELQSWFKQLKERGILLAVCSKNTENIAKEPFEKHPEMVLRMEDFAVFVANWESKVDNLRYIQSILNIGFDSMVFLDDNPVERNVVLENIKDIIVPDLPEDPSDYLTVLKSLNLFECASFTREDTVRTNQYRDEVKRVLYQKTFFNEGQYLNSLNMLGRVEGFNQFNIPRVSQLSQRSNQFNLRTKRYSETEIRSIASSSNHLCFAFYLSDKFGDHGLISVVILKKTDADELFIDTWLMSCRVLKRSMEDFILNSIAEAGRREKYKKVIGEYIQTPKNGIVASLYRELGFVQTGKYWELDIYDYLPKETFILNQEKQLK
jgi:FkbH-like protein